MLYPQISLYFKWSENNMSVSDPEQLSLPVSLFLLLKMWVFFILFIYSFIFFFTIQYFVHLRKQQDIIHFFSFLTVDRMSQFRIRWLICYLEHRQWHLLYETISQPQEKKKVRDYKYHAESRKQNTREAMLTLSLHFHN